MTQILESTTVKPALAQATGDTLTIVQSGGRRLAKLIGTGGQITGYDLAKTFDLKVWPIADLNALRETLHTLVDRSDCAVVRGSPIDPNRSTGVRRLVHRDAKTGDEPTLRETPHQWLAIDLDGVERPDDVPASDLGACATVAIQRLPKAFQGVRSIVQATGSHGIKPGCRLRLWYWCDRPVTGRELKQWLRDSPADPSVFDPSQLIYTSGPVLEAGVSDPVPQRISEISGREMVEVPEATTLAPGKVRQADYTHQTAADLDVLAAIIEQIPNDESFDSRNRFLAMGHAIAGAFETDLERGEGLFLNWCDRWHRPQTEGEPERVWNSVLASEHQAGANWILQQARAAKVDIRAYVLARAQSEFEATEDSPDNAPVAVELSDDALALAFSDRYDGQLIFVPGLQRWLFWSGARWAEDDRLRVFNLVRGVCRENAKAAEDESLSRRVSSAPTVSAVERLARADARHAHSVDQFDTDPWAINTTGGIVDLQTGRLRPHRRSDLVTKVTGATPGGACPRWLAFLSEITQGDKDIISFLQRWIGYTITGVIREHAFVFLWGPGGNGKSVLLGTVASMLGDYATTAMPDVFTVTRSEQHPTHLASLRGARMVTVTETEEGRPWAESRIKALTGGDRISARVMRGDPFEFEPQFKLWISGNHRPVLRNPDPAMRRRLHLVPLTFVPSVPDISLPDALHLELPGILAWAIDGCLAWQREGLNPPRAVQNATDEYFADQDLIGQWIEERCDRESAACTASSTLYADWAMWAGQRGERPRGEKWFSPALQRHFAKRRTKAGMEFQGVLLRPTENDWANAGSV